MPAGYSGTPLIKKLGIKPGFRIGLIDAPANYLDLLGKLPDDVTIKKRLAGTCDFVHLFADRATKLAKDFPRAKRVLDTNGLIWVSWPKKSSGVETDVTEALVRSSGLDIGLVDVKICAVDETWSGLKFVYRLKDR